jgi:hypothetical protein
MGITVIKLCSVVSVWSSRDTCIGYRISSRTLGTYLTSSQLLAAL